MDGMEGIDVIGNILEGADSGAQAPIKSEIIKIIGVGGAGCNAVNNVYKMGVDGVGLVVCNTDLQALHNSPVKCKIQLGKIKTQGLGAGNNPNVGEESAIEAADEIDKVLKDSTKMVFVAAGMGGGTGTGAAPVIAKQAKDMGILTIGIVSIPYSMEGKPRLRQAIKGAQKLSECVDSLLVVNTDRIFEMYKDTDIAYEEALSIGDNVMALAAKGLAEMISKHRRINVDFADVKGAMENSGCSLIGTAEAEGADRAATAVKAALDSPLLNNNDICGATHVLLNMSTSPKTPLKANEYGIIMTTVNQRAGGEENENFQVIWGEGTDDSVEEGKIRITIVATGFTNDVFDKQAGPKAVEVDLTGRAKTDNGVDADDEEKVQPVIVKQSEYKEVDEILANVYSKKDGTRLKQDFDPSRLRDATAIPLDKLSEEVLNDIERTPAYKRRSGE